MISENLNITNVSYIEDLYRNWAKEASSVPKAWQELFLKHGADVDNIINAVRSIPPADTELPAMPDIDQSSEMGSVQQEDTPNIVQSHKQRAVDSMLMSYRDLGVLHANTNPLHHYETPEMRYQRISAQGVGDSLAKEQYGLTDNDMETYFEIGPYFEPAVQSLSNIIALLDRTYCSTIGYEFMHIKNQSMRNWLLKRIESPRFYGEWSEQEKVRFQKDLIKSEEFESFVQRYFVGQKRFSLEGSDVFIPALHYLLYTAIRYGIHCIVLGMSHRGRLNSFTNALRKPASETFVEFIGNVSQGNYGAMGDVKYHLGHSLDFVSKETGCKIHVSLCPNPSHLEAVDSVVQGKTRGMQRLRGDWNRKKILPVLIHGDASFSGQGVVSETLNLSQLQGYRTGGTVHVIINNQIGFTTAARNARSSYFAGSIARMLQIPIFHVNGNSPEDVIRAMGLALTWRQKFGYDVVVDIVCYRKRGHNEADEPAFTHPRMYSIIGKMKSVATLYGAELDSSGIYSKSSQEQFRELYASILKKELEKAQRNDDVEIPATRAFRGIWKEYGEPYSFKTLETGVSLKNLNIVAGTLTSIPDAFTLHPKLTRLIGEREKAFKKGEGIDWSFAESLSFGSLLLEGYAIRLSGEDSARGTFSQRHAQWWDVAAEKPRMYIPLRHLSSSQGVFSVYDSPLSEFAVLGFEYGYSLTQPNSLTIWEAQFGDFVNGAQIILDQFITSGESKWFRASGLVLLLPHGYEGQGPEHSSGNLARFLQLCAGNNIQVVNATSPAQYFHLLRRQLKQPWRKPLIVMSPKSLLRHPAARSSLAELQKGCFRTVIEDTEVSKPEVLIFCSGKVYYDLIKRRADLQDTKTAIVRIEQLYPWPEEAIRNAISSYAPERCLWVQEESKNHGPWFFVAPRLQSILKGVIKDDVRYVGRGSSASPATGSFRQYQMELENFLNDAFRTVAGTVESKHQKESDKWSENHAASGNPETSGTQLRKRKTKQARGKKL